MSCIVSSKHAACQLGHGWALVPPWTSNLSGSWLRIAPWTWHHAITVQIVSLNAAHCEFNPAAALMNHRLREGFRSHSFEMLKIRSETTVRFVLTLFILKRVVKLDYVFLKILLAVLPSWQAVISADHPMPADPAVRSPHCQVVPSCDHEIWTCPNASNVEQRPAEPSCPPASTLGMAKYQDE